MTQNQNNPFGNPPTALIEDCIQNCLNAHNTAMRTATSCFQAGGDHAKPEHVQTLLDCAEICLTTAHFLMRNSDLAGYVADACNHVCEHCAGECEQMGDTDCANACRNAAYSCSQLTKIVS